MLYAVGEDPGVVMDEMGHTDEGLALSVYRQSMRRDEGERDALRALVEGVPMEGLRTSPYSGEASGNAVAQPTEGVSRSTSGV